jgi:hypothetical protein
VRLAAKLTGLRIDIKSEEEKRREVEAQFEGLEARVEDAEGVKDAEAQSAEVEAQSADVESAEVESAEAAAAEAPEAAPEGTSETKE